MKTVPCSASSLTRARWQFLAGSADLRILLTRSVSQQSHHLSAPSPVANPPTRWRNLRRWTRIFLQWNAQLPAALLRWKALRRPAYWVAVWLEVVAEVWAVLGVVYLLMGYWVKLKLTSPPWKSRAVKQLWRTDPQRRPRIEKSIKPRHRRVPSRAKRPLLGRQWCSKLKQMLRGKVGQVPPGIGPCRVWAAWKLTSNSESKRTTSRSVAWVSDRDSWPPWLMAHVCRRWVGQSLWSLAGLVC